MVSRFVLRPAPVGDPTTLLSLHLAPRGEPCCNEFPLPVYDDIRDQAKGFSGVAAFYELLPASIAGGAEPERVWGQAVTPNFFDVLELPMVLGRGFSRPKTEPRSLSSVRGYGRAVSAAIRRSLARTSRYPDGPLRWSGLRLLRSTASIRSSTRNSGFRSVSHRSLRRISLRRIHVSTIGSRSWPAFAPASRARRLQTNLIPLRIDSQLLIQDGQGQRIPIRTGRFS